MNAGARADVHDIIRGAHRFLVVLDDDQRVAEIAQTLQRIEQLCVVALVQTDARFVENIQHADQPAADLRRKADALALAARKRRRAARKRQVAEADVDQKSEPRVKLL